MNINAVDLNLLKAFDALVREQNVTRAAEGVGLTQPAMSNALSRLRHLFGDELLVRAPGGMAPTPRALALAEPIRTALDQINQAVNFSAEFDPATARRAFTIAMNDYASLMTLPDLMPVLKREAPGIDLRVISPPTDITIDMMGEDKVDMTVGVFNDRPTWMRTTPIADLEFVAVACRTNPSLKNGLDFDTYVEMGHVLISQRGDPSGFVDDVLAERGLKRRVALTIPHFLVAPYVLSNTNLVAVLGRPMAELLQSSADIGIWPLPFELEPLQAELGWHDRFTNDPAHSWLRDRIREIRDTA